MKPVVIGLVIAVISIIAVVGGGFYLALPLASRFVSGFDGRGDSQPFSSIPSNQSPPPPSSPSPNPSVLVPPVGTGQPGVVFELAVTGVSGSGLTQTVSAQISNTGAADAHNVWVKAEVFCQGQRVRLNGQEYIRVNIGDIRAKTSVNAQATLSVSATDGLKIAMSGARINLTINSDEASRTISYDYKP